MADDNSLYPEAFGGARPLPQPLETREQLDQNLAGNAIAGLSPVVPTPAMMAVEQAPLQSPSPTDTTTVNPVTPEAIQAASDRVAQLRGSSQLQTPAQPAEPETQAATESPELGESMFTGQAPQPSQEIPDTTIADPSNALMIDQLSKMQRANSAIAGAQALAFNNSAKLHEQAASNLAEMQLKEAERIKNFQAETENYKNKMQTLADDIKNSKPDLKDYWADKGTGTKVLAAIAVGLGGYASGGGRNGALDIINKAVDDDMAKQKYIYEQGLQNKRTALQAQDTIYGRAMQTFNDVGAATAFVKGLALDQTQQKLAEMQSRMGGQVAQQEAVKFNAELEQKKIMAGQQLQAALQQKIYLDSIGGVNALAKKTPTELQQLVERGIITKEQASSSLKQSELTLRGTDIVMPDKESRIKLEEKIQDAIPALQNLRELYQITDPKKFSQLSPDERYDIQTRVAEIAGSLRTTILGPGVMDKGEFERLKEALGGSITDILSFTSNAAKRKQMLGLANRIETGVKSQIQLYAPNAKAFQQSSTNYRAVPKK